jgi:spermidine synthase
MFTKLVLPRFGGVPSVWSVAIVFFQCTLLAGYAYAHWLMRVAGRRTGAAIHIAVMLAATLWLPLSIAEAWAGPSTGNETLRLIGVMAASMGPPFFALAATAPLLQAWIARSEHPAAENPYFLYAFSNAGSLLALLSYPLMVEPLVTLSHQTRYWSVAFYLLVALVAGCSLVLWPWQADPTLAGNDTEQSPPTWRDGARWATLAAVPAGLLVAVTAHISTDVAPVPLLWIIPLALYLLSFIIVFARRQIVPQQIIVFLQPLFVIALAALLVFETVKSIVWVVAAHAVVFFVCALMCHGEIARTRPAPAFLTAFYLWMAAGGAIGGVAAAVIAPHLFSWVAEYPLLLALAVLCRPPTALPGRRYVLIGALAAAASLLVVCTFFPETLDERSFRRTAGMLLVACVPLSLVPAASAALIASVLIASHGISEHPAIVSVRSFFGVAKVIETSDHRFRILQHGTTMHGGQRIEAPDGERPADERPEQLLYYFDGSGIAQTFDAMQAQTAHPQRYAVIGLGTGSLACRARPGDHIDFYEIDPAIVRIARNPALFTFLSACAKEAPIVLGDARLTLAQAERAAYDLIVVDAFTSDAIPVHLLTREAMAIYLDKLGAHGMIVMHISNRHLELASVVAGIAAANGLVTLFSDGPDPDDEYKFSGTVAAVARSLEDFGSLRQWRDWEPIAPDPAQRIWTDDYCNIVGALWRRLREDELSDYVAHSEQHAGPEKR